MSSYLVCVFLAYSTFRLPICDLELLIPPAFDVSQIYYFRFAFRYIIKEV